MHNREHRVSTRTSELPKSPVLPDNSDSTPIGIVTLRHKFRPSYRATAGDHPQRRRQGQAGFTIRVNYGSEIRSHRYGVPRSTHRHPRVTPLRVWRNSHNGIHAKPREMLLISTRGNVNIHTIRKRGSRQTNHIKQNSTSRSVATQHRNDAFTTPRVATTFVTLTNHKPPPHDRVPRH